MNSNKDRLHYIDHAKGIAVLLVILGHALQFSGGSGGFLYDLIYSFHMPLFFVISGFLFKVELFFVKKIFLRIFVPFVFWSLLLLFLRNFFDPDYNFLNLNYFVYLLIPSGFWFLYVLFVFYLAAYLYDGFKTRYPFVLFLLFIIISVFLFGVNFLSLNLILWNFPFFVIGFFVKRFGLKIKGNCFYYLVIYLLFFFVWAISFENFVFKEIVFSKLYYIFIRVLTPLFAITALFCFLHRCNFRNSFLLFFANNSLGFYVIQSIVFLVFLEAFPDVSAWLLFFVILSITSLLVYLSTKYYVFRILVGLK